MCALIKFADGSIASFETSWVLPKNQPEPLDPSLQVVGDKGSIIVEGSSMGLQIQTENIYIVLNHCFNEPTHLGTDCRDPIEVLCG